MEIKSISRLQFRHHSDIFTGATLEEARAEAIKYVERDMWYQDTSAECDGTNPLGHSLYAEPTVVKYAVDGEENDAHVILVIGADTNETNRPENNKFCIIDIDKTEQEIADLGEELEKAIKALTLIVSDSNTLDLDVNKTENGTYLSGEVKTARYHVFNDITKYNNIMIGEGGVDGPEGLFLYVDLVYDEVSESFKFVVTNADGTLKETTVTLPNNYLVSGEYDKTTESLKLYMKNGDTVIIDCEELIGEWGVEGEASKTPIVLTKQEVDYDNTEEHHHVEPWQDVLRADVRLRDEIKDETTGKYTKDPNSTNILNRTTNGQYLYVDGKASNIIYYWEGEKSNVKDQLDKLNRIKVSQDNDNIIWDRVDGFFASTKLDYISNKNQLVFTTTNVSGGTISKNIQLNTVELFQNVYYDPTTEELVLTYKDGEGNLKVVRIPIGQMLDEWDVLNEGHSVELVKKPHQVSGKDILTADVKISDGENNILIDRNHTLYVRGTADNIKYGEGTVKDTLDGLISEDETLNEKIDNEIERAEAAEQELIDKIGTGFTSDQHENVTYKFEQLQNQVNTEADKLQNEIDRSTDKDVEHDEKLAEQQAEIEAISADSTNSLKDIINNDHSIDVDKTDSVRPVIKVNLSEHEPYNTIRLEGDGLYNFIDLEYNSDTNKLTFIRSDKDSTENKTKEIQLNSVPFDITYDKNREVLIITYHTSEGEKTVEIDLHDLIHDEWEVYNDPNSAVKLDKSESVSGTDILSAEVVLSSRSGVTEDNIIENVNGALYVPANTNVTEALSNAINSVDTKVDNEITRAISAETALSGTISTVQTNLNTEIDRATAAETRIETKVDNEITRATAEDQRLYTLIVDEQVRATNADQVLDGKINDEAIARVQGDAVLETKISGETAAREAKDTILETAINTEVTRATAEDQRLANAIAAEETARQEGDAELADAIRAATLTFDDTSSIDFTKTTGNVVSADVKLQGGDNIIKLGSGLYATATLEYEPTGNKIRLVTSNGAQEYIQLVGATLLDSIDYDPVNKILVITYTDGTGSQRETSVGVTDLWNDWIVQNPSEKSAVEMTKTIGDPGNPDTLSARVLITDDRDGDGKPDEGSNNLIEIKNNGLYVDGSSITGAVESVECVKNEVKGLQNIIGQVVGECNSAATYTAWNVANYINTATSFNNADFILDQAIKNIDVKVDVVSAKTDCVDNATKKIYEVLYGEGIAMPECGEGVHYQPYVGACIISAATSFNEADQMLNDQICKLLEMWVSGMTCTTESNWIDEGANKKMQVDVRPSYGNDAEMTEDNLYIHDQVGDYIEPGVTEFTDTNALRIVCLTEGGSVIPDVKSKQNGLYLSNVWDCGMYYSPSDTEAKEAAEAAGYITSPYSTDEDSSASGFNYMNNVRQTDIPVE